MENGEKNKRNRGGKKEENKKNKQNKADKKLVVYDSPTAAWGWSTVACGFSTVVSAFDWQKTKGNRMEEGLGQREKTRTCLQRSK